MPTRKSRAKPKLKFAPLSPKYSRLTPHPTRPNVWIGKGHASMWIIEPNLCGGYKVRQAGSKFSNDGTYIPSLFNTLGLINFWLRQDEHCQRYTHRSSGPR
jgi:hypothetical protein